MEYDKKLHELLLEGGNEMEAVAIACAAVVASSRRQRSSGGVIEATRNLSQRAAEADVTPPDSSTGRKELVISRGDVEIAIDAARQFSDERERQFAPYLPQSVHDAIVAIATVSIDESDRSVD